MTPYNQGRQSYLQGLDRTANPYQHTINAVSWHKWAYDEWHLGWSEAEDDYDLPC